MSSTGPLRVMLVEDQELVRSGLKMIFERAGLAVVAEAGDGEEAVMLVRQTAREHQPQVVLMDVQMPRMNGIDATREVIRLMPDVKVVALTTFDLDEYVYGAVKAGASGFLLKHMSPSDLVHAIHAVARGDTILAPSLTRRLLERFAARPLPGHRPERLDQLSERETEVMTLVARGLTNSDISHRLFLSEATVKTYVSRLRTKLNLRDRVHVALVAYETGLVQPGSDDHPKI
ncbi:MAG: response regulator transcription factor [Euzebyaceae bacterium]|nr:response regulator transcription factor [Euzebyaceae bacterium]MBA3888206.1 response regulator transcription factor [Acidobacteriota bacterium]